VTALDSPLVQEVNTRRRSTTTASLLST